MPCGCEVYFLFLILDLGAGAVKSACALRGAEFGSHPCQVITIAGALLWRSLALPRGSTGTCSYVHRHTHTQNVRQQMCF